MPRNRLKIKTFYLLNFDLAKGGRGFSPLNLLDCTLVCYGYYLQLLPKILQQLPQILLIKLLK